MFSTTNLLLLILAGCVGSMIATYMPINTQLAKTVGSSLVACIALYGLGLITIIIMVVLLRQFDAVKQLPSAPMVQYLPGVLSALAMVAMTFLIGRIGATSTFITVIALQLFTATIIDHYGWVGVAQRSVNGQVVVGILLFLVGMVLVNTAKR